MATIHPRKVSDCALVTGLSSNDKLFVVSNDVGGVTNNALITASNFFSNTPVSFMTTGNNAVSTANLVVRTATTMQSNSIGVEGQIKWDINFIYVCIANNVWKRVALSSF